MGDPAYGGHAIDKRALNLVIQWLSAKVGFLGESFALGGCGSVCECGCGVCVREGAVGFDWVRVGAGR